MTSIPPCPAGMKRCTRCQQCLPATLEYFAYAKSKKDGLHSWCKPCASANAVESRRQRKANPKPPPTEPPCPAGTRRCTRCKQCLPATLEYFAHSDIKRDRLQSWCKKCVIENGKIYRAAHPEQYKYKPKPNARKKVLCPDGMKKCYGCDRCLPATTQYFTKDVNQSSGLHHRCKDCAHAARQVYRVRQRAQRPPVEPACPAGMKQCRKCEQCFPATTEYFPYDAKGRGKLNYQCKTCANQAGRTYKRTHRDKMSFARQVDSHRRRAAVGRFTRQDVLTLYEMQGGRCAWCSESMSRHKPPEESTLPPKFTIDHIVPIKRGGTNWAWNIILACSECNLSRGKKWVGVEWQPPNFLTRITNYLIEVMVLELLWHYGRWWYLLGRV